MSVQYGFGVSKSVISGMKGRAQTVKARTRALFRDFVENTNTEIINVTPYRTGDLVDSGGYIIDTPMKVTFYSDAKHSEIMHNKRFKHYTTPGTGPFFISVPMRANLQILKAKLKDLYRRGY